MIRRSLYLSTLSLFLATACGGSGATRTAPPAGPATGGTATTEPTTGTEPGVPAEPPAAVGHPRTDLIPRAVLFGNPERGAPELSPDGKQIAYSAPVDGVMNVFVAPADDLAKSVQVTFDKVRPIRNYGWSMDSKYVLYQQDIGGDENFHLFRVGLDGKDALDLTDRKGVKVDMIGASVSKPDHILVGMNDRDPQLHDVYDVEVSSGNAKLVLENPGYVGFVADDGLKLRQASQFQPDGSIKRFKSGDRSAAWIGLDEISSDDQLTTNTLGYETSGKRYYEIDARGRDTAALYAVDARSGKRTLLAEDPKADAGGGFIFHPKTGVIRAVAFNRARPEWKILDKSIAGDLAALKKLDEGDFFVTSMSFDDKVWIVGFNGDRVPTRFWRWDRKAKKGTMLYSTRPALDGLPLARMHSYEIPARDGLPLVSYLSLPAEVDPDGDGTPDKAVPMVLFVHGGPWARDNWGYHPVAQLLANRGYAVLRVNYRGSTGFGKNFINAANREWGKKMHDDLLDAVSWAVGKGITTSDQVCIMGGSYGGYATLAGLTLTPKTFKCGVDIVGPSNLITLAESAPPYWKPIISVFKTRMGDWTTPEGREAMLAVSPLTHAGKIERPLLIGQGANDPRVKQAESDQIVKAMKAKGLPVTYVLFPDEGHGFARPENNIAFMALAEAFLSAHLGGSYQPAAADDFAGSTVQIKEGARGIPGLPAGVGR
ncbi:MAG TPA: S9 family peptidase [Kofleriaceae bacterium]|nr:S9 family peptidase [Kofleriaceae bacterium]